MTAFNSEIPKALLFNWCRGPLLMRRVGSVHSNHCAAWMYLHYNRDSRPEMMVPFPHDPHEGQRCTDDHRQVWEYSSLGVGGKEVATWHVVAHLEK